MSLLQNFHVTIALYLILLSRAVFFYWRGFQLKRAAIQTTHRPAEYSEDLLKNSESATKIWDDSDNSFRYAAYCVIAMLVIAMYRVSV